MLTVAKKSAETAVDRLKRRVAERIDADRDRPPGYRKTQADLAAAIGIAKGTLNELLNGASSTRGLLAYLDRIADYFGVPPSLLVHRNDTALMEIHPSEHRLLTHWRTFPPDVQETVMSMFDYFSGLLPEEKEERRIWQKWRRLSPKDREHMERQLTELTRLSRRSAGTNTAPAPTAPTTADEPASVPPVRQTHDYDR